MWLDSKAVNCPQKWGNFNHRFGGYWLLVTGYWLLVTGYWLLVTGWQVGPLSLNVGGALGRRPTIPNIKTLRSQRTGN